MPLTPVTVQHRFALVNPTLASEPWASDIDTPEGFLKHAPLIEQWMQQRLEEAQAAGWKRGNTSERATQFGRQNQAILMQELDRQLTLYRQLAEADATISFFGRRYAQATDTGHRPADEHAPVDGEAVEAHSSQSPLQQAVRQVEDWKRLEITASAMRSELRLAMTDTLYALSQQKRGLWGWLTEPFNRNPTARWLEGWSQRADIPWEKKSLLRDALAWRAEPALRDEELGGVERLKQVGEVSKGLVSALRAREQATTADITRLAGTMPGQLQRLFQLQAEGINEQKLLPKPKRRWWTGIAEAWRELTRQPEPPSPLQDLSQTEKLWLDYGHRNKLGQPEGQSWWQQIEQLKRGGPDILQLKQRLDSVKQQLPEPTPLTEDELQRLYALAADWLGFTKLPKQLDGFGQGAFASVMLEMRNEPGMRSRGTVALGHDGDVQLHASLNRDLRKFMAFMHELGHAEIYAEQTAVRNPEHRPMSFVDRHSVASSVQEAKAFFNEQLFFTLMRQIRPDDALLQAHAEVTRLNRLAEAGRSLERVMAEKAMRQVVEDLGGRDVSPEELNRRFAEAVAKAAPNLAEYSPASRFTEAARQGLKEYPHLMALPDIGEAKPFKSASYLMAAMTALPLAMAPQAALDDPRHWRQANQQLMALVRQDALHPDDPQLTLARFSGILDQQFGLKREQSLAQAPNWLRQHTQQLEATVATAKAATPSPAVVSEAVPTPADQMILGSGEAGTARRHSR